MDSFEYPPIVPPLNIVELPKMVSGLTKREYFAAMAMQGMIARDSRYGFEETGKVSCFYADALLAALERKPE